MTTAKKNIPINGEPVAGVEQPVETEGPEVFGSATGSTARVRRQVSLRH